MKAKWEPKKWGLLWRSKNRLDGVTQQFMWDSPCTPLLFESRRQARDYANQHFGYIKTRPDLRTEPHGWHMPKAVRVRVRLEEIR